MNFLFELLDNRKNQGAYKLFCVLACAYMAINFIMAFCEIFFCSGVHAYMAAHHFLNYHFGIVPRAFYGATIGELTQILPKALYFILWLLICCIPYIVYFCVYLRMRKSSNNVDNLDAFAVFSLLLPTTFLPLNDFLRLDIVLLNWFVLCALVVWSRHWCRFLIPFIMIIMTLTHEGAIFMFLPTLCGMAFYKSEKKIDFALTGWLCFGVLCSLIVYLFISRTPISWQEIDAFLQKRNTFGELVKGELTLKSHIESVQHGYLLWTITKGFTPAVSMKILFAIPFFSIALAIVLYAWYAIYNTAKDNVYLKWKIIFLFFTTLSNICLFIGCDYNRWVWSWLSVNILLLFLLFGDKNIKQIAPIKQKHKYFFTIALLIFLLTGTGDCHSFTKFTRLCGEAAGYTIQKICNCLQNK